MSSLPPPPGAPLGPPPRLLEGHLFAGRFRIGEALEDDPYQPLYAVEQLSDRRRLWLTVLPAGLAADGAALAHFLEAAGQSARWTSDRIAPILAAGIHEGLPWTVTTPMPGETLEARISNAAPMAWDEVSSFFEQLGLPLGTLHAQGQAHGDLVPRNVFLEGAGPSLRGRTLRLLRVGTGRLVQEARRACALAGDDDEVVHGTWWTAPEQWQAHRTTLPAADVWALGLLAFQLLTGEMYWHTATLAAPTRSELVEEMRREPSTPADARAAEHGLEARLPPGFADWFAHCVQRDVSARFGDAAAAIPPLLRLLAREDAPLEARRSVLLEAPRAALDASVGAGLPTAPALAAEAPSAPPITRPQHARTASPTPPSVHGIPDHAPPALDGEPASERGAPFLRWRSPAASAMGRRAAVALGASAVLGAAATFVGRLRGPGTSVGDRPRPEAAPGLASASHPWPAGRPTRWRGTWSLGAWRLEVEYELTRDAEAVDGLVRYRIAATPPGPAAARLGERTEERVEGHVDGEGRLTLVGRDGLQPNVVSPGRHVLELDDTGTLRGEVTHDDGVRARVEARPMR